MVLFCFMGIYLNINTFLLICSSHAIFPKDILLVIMVDNCAELITVHSSMGQVYVTARRTIGACDMVVPSTDVREAI